MSLNDGDQFYKTFNDLRCYKTESMVIKAARKRDLATLGYILDKMPDAICDLVYEKVTPLAVAAMHGYTDVAAVVLNHPQVDVNAGDRLGYSPLVLASIVGYCQIVREFLSASVSGLDVNHRTDDGSVALHCAALGGYYDIVELLLNCPDIECDVANSNDTTPLMLAAKEGHNDVVQLLLATGKVDVNACDMRGRTALFYAAKNDNTNVVAILLRCSDLELNAADCFGTTPFLAAACHNSYWTAKYLLQHCQGLIDVNQTDVDGKSALFYAVEQGNVCLFQALMAEPSVDINLANRMGDTPLHRAVYEEDDEFVAGLLMHPDIDANLRGRNSETALQVATRKGYLDIVKLLLKEHKEHA